MNHTFTVEQTDPVSGERYRKCTSCGAVMFSNNDYFFNMICSKAVDIRVKTRERLQKERELPTPATSETNDTVLSKAKEIEKTLPVPEPFDMEDGNFPSDRQLFSKINQILEYLKAENALRREGGRL